MEKEYVIMELQGAGSKREPTYYTLKRAEIWGQNHEKLPLFHPLTDDELRGIFTTHERAEMILEYLLKSPTHKQYTIVTLYSTFIKPKEEIRHFRV